MILFLEDWAKYPNAIIHKETKNESWLRLAALYKRMGIKNHAFLLALHNPILKDIDPYDENLSDDLKVLIAEECIENPWYYFREVCRVPSKAGNIDIRLRANRANIGVYWLFFNHITSYLIQPRQTGKSLTITELKAYLGDLGTTNTELSLLTKDDKLRDKLSREIRANMDLLPLYLKFISKKDVKNSEKITIKELNNVITLYVGLKDKKSAENIGRGMTTPISVIDELAFVYNVHLSLPIMLSGTVAAREVAEASGAPYGTIFVTTPGNTNTPEGAYAYKLYKNAFRWTEKLFDLKNREELVEFIDKNSSSENRGIVLLEFNHRQLGYDDKWLLNRIKVSLTEGEEIDNNFFNKWIGGNLKTPIKPELMKIIEENKNKNPDIEVSEDGYILYWHKTGTEKLRLLENGFLSIGLDTSDAIGNDDIALTMVHSITGEVVATGTYNETNLILLSKFIADLLIKYPNSILIPERKSSAVTMIDNIIRILDKYNINPFLKIFNWIINDAKYKENPKEKKYIYGKNSPGINYINKFKKYFGFATSGGGRTSRNELYGNLFNYSIKYLGNKIYDEKIISQLKSLEIRNGRIDHPDGEHDDAVISWLLAIWFLTKADNKQDYKLPVNNILQNVIDNEILVKNKDIKKEDIEKQEKLKEEILKLITILNNEKNPYTAVKILNKIKMLYKKINFNIIKSFNIDEILNEIKILKKVNKLIK